MDLDQGLLSWASTANINDNNSQIDNTMYYKIYQTPMKQIKHFWYSTLFKRISCTTGGGYENII